MDVDVGAWVLCHGTVTGPPLTKPPPLSWIFCPLEPLPGVGMILARTSSTSEAFNFLVLPRAMNAKLKEVGSPLVLLGALGIVKVKLKEPSQHAVALPNYFRYFYTS